MTLRFALILLLLGSAFAVAAPTAHAHSEMVSQAQSVEVGPYVAWLEPSPSPIYANTSNQGFTLQVVDANAGGRVDVPARMIVGGPNGFREGAEFRAANDRYKLATLHMPHAGNYTIRLVLTAPDGEEHIGIVNFEAYPDLPFRLQPVDPSYDVIPDARTTLAYETVHPVTGERVDEIEDLTVRVEHWSGDHREILDTTELQAERTGVGLWKVEHVFPEGHYFLRFASESGDFSWDALPELHVNVVEPLGYETRKTNDTPDGGAAIAVAAAGFAAVALALARRR